VAIGKKSLILSRVSEVTARKTNHIDKKRRNVKANVG
jgi:hypothetical protein